jgi:hypothetical protein
MISILDKKYFRYSGRILEKENSAYLGFTNSTIEFYVKCKSKDKSVITASIGTERNGEVNDARLKVYIDDSREESLLVLNKEINDYTLATLTDNETHKITIIKITEASMSYAKLNNITIEGGEILPLEPVDEKRMKVEFIGDSITCGYGVYGAPNSEFHIKEEDGMLSYASIVSQSLNLNARYFSVSGYGVFVKYDGDPEGIIPKVYPYTNYFIDEKEFYDFNEFIPDLVVINLGTNDSGHLHKEEIQKGFTTNYINLIKYIKSNAPNTKVLCTCGTLCTNAFPFVQKAVNQALNDGIRDLYTFELPYHDVEHDGMASGHPSIITHQKDAERLSAIIKDIMNI